MKIREYCECGGSVVGSISPDSRARPLVRIFWETHTGIGHSKVDARKCYQARYKAERIGIAKA